MRGWQKQLLCVVGALILLFIVTREINTSSDSSSQWHVPLSGKVIVIDPGHGGVDGGAVGEGNVIEKDITLKIAKDIRDYLQEAGAYVLLTRNDDRDLADEDMKGLSRRKTQDLHRRLAFVKEADADLFISLHLNAIPSSKWRGAQTFYHPHLEESEKLAKFIQDAIRSNLENTKRFAKPINHVFLLKRVEMPSALIEVGFLSNPAEKRLLQTEDYQHKVAASIYQGVLRFYTNEPIPSS